MNSEKERKSQTIIGIIAVIIIAALIMTAVFSIVKALNAKSNAMSADEAYSTLQNTDNVPKNATKDGGVVFSKNNEKDIPTVEIYLDPLCPACTQVDRLLNATLEKMYNAGQIQMEIHPLDFLDANTNDQYSNRTSSAIAYISEKDPDHTINFIGKLYEENFQPSETDYQSTSDEKIVERAIAAGVAKPVAEESVKGNYRDWAKNGTNYTLTRNDLVAPGRKGFATPLIKVNGAIWSMNGIYLNELADEFVRSLGLTSREVGEQGKRPSIGSKGFPITDDDSEGTAKKND